MKLEKFAKNKKQKKIIIGTIVELIVLIGGITLYGTFALYEEKKEFNVLKGRVPDFTVGDIKFAYTIEDESGTKTPSSTIPEGTDYDVTVTCNNEATGEWDYVEWGPIIKNLNATNTKCDINFKTGRTFNFGDGSLNTVARDCPVDSDTYRCGLLNFNEGGYVNKLYIHDFETGKDTKLSPVNSIYTGNFNDCIFDDDDSYYGKNNKNLSLINTFTYPTEGQNLFSTNLVGTENKFIMFFISWAGNSNTVQISNLLLNLDGTDYTLKSAVENKKIKPIVLMTSLSYQVSLYVGDNAARLYGGGAFKGSYSRCFIYFMLEKDVTLKNVKINYSKNIIHDTDFFKIYESNNQIFYLK